MNNGDIYPFQSEWKQPKDFSWFAWPRIIFQWNWYSPILPNRWRPMAKSIRLKDPGNTSPKSGVFIPNKSGWNDLTLYTFCCGALLPFFAGIGYPPIRHACFCFKGSMCFNWDVETYQIFFHAELVSINSWIWTNLNVQVLTASCLPM